MKNTRNMRLVKNQNQKESRSSEHKRLSELKRNKRPLPTEVPYSDL